MSQIDDMPPPNRPQNEPMPLDPAPTQAMPGDGEQPKDQSPGFEQYVAETDDYQGDEEPGEGDGE